MIYNKLVRDKIPLIIKKSKREASFEKLNNQDFKRALLDKLIEEAQEARDASISELPLEIADVKEVLEAIVETFEIENEVIKCKQRRLDERGGFTKKLRLISVED